MGRHGAPSSVAALEAQVSPPVPRSVPQRLSASSGPSDTDCPLWPLRVHVLSFGRSGGCAGQLGQCPSAPVQRPAGLLEANCLPALQLPSADSDPQPDKRAEQAAGGIGHKQMFRKVIGEEIKKKAHAGGCDEAGGSLLVSRAERCSPGSQHRGIPPVPGGSWGSPGTSRGLSRSGSEKTPTRAQRAVLP